MSNSSSSNWDAVKFGGSEKRKIVNPDLIEERAKCNFDKTELVNFVIGEEVLEEFNELVDEMGKDPNLQTDIHFSSLPREEQHKIWWKIIKAAYNNPKLGPRHFHNNDKRKSLSFCWSYMF
jgi:acyl-CoA oxidase